MGTVRTITVTELTSSLDAHVSRHGLERCAIATDGDGTLWSGDIGEDFFEALLREGRVSDVARAPLAREAEAEGIDATGDAVAIAQRIHAAYHAGTFPEERVCEIMTWAFAGWSRVELDRFAASVIEAVGLRARLHGEALRVIAWARERGVMTCLVSASPRAIVEAAARLVGIDLAHVTSATELCDDGGVVRAACDLPIPYGEGKVTRLRAIVGERALVAAFGDNAFDVAMLSQAAVPVAIRPKPRLLARAGEVPDLVVLERVTSA
ncbi:MAG: HAD-IB family phosphatase [Labilithrix sp.]|nr:HAD-IB family phosphatase [Labilithrix sp.]